MISKVFILFLIQFNYRFLNGFENRFCDNSYKDSLLAFGGIFSFDDTLFATRRYPNTDQTIVWKFKLKVIDNKPNLKDSRFEITDMSSHEMKSLFPGLMFDYFVSGFAITDINPCDNKSEECVNTSDMNNLTVILGPNDLNSRQPYAVYRFNGITFKRVDPKTEAIPLRLGEKGTTTLWFSPKTFITTTFRQKEKQIIGFNYGDKTINKLELKNTLFLSVKHHIRNQFWDPLASLPSVDSFFYHLIELKVTETQRKLLLITQQMVYQVLDDKRVEEVMPPWDLFGCKSVAKSLAISLRSAEMGSKRNLSRAPVVLDEYENVNIYLTLELIATNLIYISLILVLFFKNQIQDYLQKYFKKQNLN